MRCYAFGLLAIVILIGCWSDTPNPGSSSVANSGGAAVKNLDPAVPSSTGAQAGVPGKSEREKITFPYFLPGSHIVVGKELVDEVNALATKEEQIQFLIKVLPPSNQKSKELSDRQLYAIRMLSLTDSDVVITPLMDRFDFIHKGDGWPVVHAMARLGERSVEPLLERLRGVTSDRQKVANCGAALIEMKKDQFPAFIGELKKRKDVKLSDAILNEILVQHQSAPNL